MEITKREIIVSIAIVAIMLLIGFVLSDVLAAAQNEKNAEYQKAIQIEDSNMFRHGMDTSIGNAFVYGELQAVDPVTFNELGGEYLWIKKTEEHYNRHTRTVTKTRTVNGKTETYMDTEVYYSWDYHDSWVKNSRKIQFCGIEFDYGMIRTPRSSHIKTENESSRVRYVYSGTGAEHTGTIYTTLQDGTILSDSKFYKGKTPEEARDICTSSFLQSCFWVIWIIVTVGVTWLFVREKNLWLE